MPQPRDITGSIYKSKKLKSGPSTRKLVVESSEDSASPLGLRRLGFSSFSFAVGLLLVIAVLGQLVLMSLFHWM